MAGKRTMKLASRGKRFGAACIDMVVPVFAYIVVMIVTHGAGLGQTMPYGYGFGNDFGSGFGNDFGSGFGYGYGYGYPYGMRVSGAAIAAMIFLSLILIAYMVVQFVFFSKSKSIGKSMLGLQVVSSRDGKPLGFWRMMLRECIVKSADSPLLLGYIWVLIDDKNRAWHDKILDTYVVDLKESERLSNDRRREAARAAAGRLENQAPEVKAQAQADDSSFTMKPAAPAEEATATEVKELELVPEKPETGETAAPELRPGIPEKEETAELNLEPEVPDPVEADSFEMVPEEPVVEVKMPSELILSAEESEPEAAAESIADKSADVPVEEAAEEINEAARIL